MRRRSHQATKPEGWPRPFDPIESIPRAFPGWFLRSSPCMAAMAEWTGCAAHTCERAAWSRRPSPSGRAAGRDRLEEMIMANIRGPRQDEALAGAGDGDPIFGFGSNDSGTGECHPRRPWTDTGWFPRSADLAARRKLLRSHITDTRRRSWSGLKARTSTQEPTEGAGDRHHEATAWTGSGCPKRAGRCFPRKPSGLGFACR